MRSKKQLLILLCCGLLTGCSSKTMSSAVNEEKISPTTVPVTEVSTEPETEPEAESAALTDKEMALEQINKHHDTKGKISYKIKDTMVEVYYLNYKLFELDAGYRIEDTYSIIVNDYNFDGYDDLFVPDEPSDVYNICTLGDYWLCDPEKLDFVKSDEMAVYFGHGVKMNVDEEKLSVQYSEHSPYIYSSYTGSLKISYVWRDGKFVPDIIEKTQNHYADDLDTKLGEDECYKDYYAVDENGNVILKERRVFENGTDQLRRTEENVQYLRVTEESVDNMRGQNVVQHIPVKDIEKNTAVIFDMPQDKSCMPMMNNCLIELEDYNFDGYNDLRIITGVDEFGMEAQYRFYRYEPSSGMYVEWDELNSLSGNIYLNENDKKLSVNDTVMDENTVYFYETAYLWENGRLKPESRSQTVSIYNDDGSVFMTKVDYFKYDENGNEYKYYKTETPKIVG